MRRAAFAGGAWSETAVITPVLTATLATPGTVTLSWPSFWPGYTLEENTNLPNPAGWNPVLVTPNNDGTNNSVHLLVSPSANRFFRLRH